MITHVQCFATYMKETTLFNDFMNVKFFLDKLCAVQEDFNFFNVVVSN